MEFPSKAKNVAYVRLNIEFDAAGQQSIDLAWRYFHARDHTNDCRKKVDLAALGRAMGLELDAARALYTAVVRLPKEDPH